MQPLILSTYDQAGGAARAAYRLHTGLRSIGSDSAMLVLRRDSSDPSVIQFCPPFDLPARLRRRVRREWLGLSEVFNGRLNESGYELFSNDCTQFGSTLIPRLPACDVVNLHWVRNFVDLQAFLSGLPWHVPVVWTLHDMNLFTGGCHYDDNCDRFTNHCGACPQLGSENPTDLSHHILRRKQRIFQRLHSGRLQVVAPSNWMAQQARRSTLLRSVPVMVIPYGLETDKFTPQDRAEARYRLDIPQSARVVLFVADSVANRRKGIALLTRALGNLVDTPDLYLLSVGREHYEMELPFSQQHLGTLRSDQTLATAYSAADLFVIPSLQDNLPNTVMEAMSCGLPVVGFATGGIPDMVRPGVTGLLVPTGNVALLRSAIKQLLDHPETRIAMGRNARRIAVEEYALDVQARRYLRLYETMLQRP